MKDTCSSRLLYLRHLAERLRAFESGAVAVDAKAFRLFARRLREATLGRAEPELLREAGRHPEILDVLGARYFETHGRFGPSAEARALQRSAEALIARAMAR